MCSHIGAIVAAAAAVALAILAIRTLHGKKALKAWKVVNSPSCDKDTTPPICAGLLADPGPVPDPGRPKAVGFDSAAATFAARLVGRFITGIRSRPDLLGLAGMPAPSLVYAPRDARPLIAVWADGVRAVVAVRGTQTIADLASDLSYNQMSVPSIAQVRHPRGGTEVGLNVHGGMYRMWASVRSAVFAAIPPSTKKLFVAGHSLGAAVAFFIAYEAPPALTVEVVGLAPPRAGNAAFASAVARRARTLSVINAADLIPTTPWSYMPNSPDPWAYAHVHPLAFFSDSSTDIASCHAMPTYFNGIISGTVAVLP
jgi:hypothetical protein